ncbi:MAG: M23 family metallopeptidase [Pseudanabaenaceae cyanobacterium]
MFPLLLALALASPCPDCFVLVYPDRDSSAGFKDYRCGDLSYDGHTGTDFAVADEGRMRAGVRVVAAAAGRVLRVRDGVVDRRVTDPSTVKGQECGNGVVIDHGGGWETQYCHLRQGSVQVRPGQWVEQGTVLGLVGQSGLASFPHVHFAVRHQGRTIDPNGGVEVGKTCQSNQGSLWQRPIPYVPTGLIHAGFSPQEPTLAELEAGKWEGAKITSKDKALVFWTRSYGVKKGDRVRMTLVNPSQQTVVDYQTTLDKDNRFFMLFSGTRQLNPGVWTATFHLERNSEQLIAITRTINVREN